MALCEIAGIRGRIVMHVIGGHVTTELHVDGHWGYVDPRMGVYFLNADGKLASLRELCADPGLPDRQSEAVKHDVVGYETWANRRTRSAVYFSPAEVNLFEYYSLNDAARYDYHQVPRSAADAAGLREINREYSKIITEISEQAR
ncbi:hypothetical protein SDC9_120345 [bioreactor metagenome]|uniref:Uncharacterized protein n=1 Tax=bioreactor metagenome TaxID=1076179 RepID=A0A645C710_9ZZZZ